MRLAARILLVLLLAGLFLAGLSALAFGVGGLLFGLTGHPAGPDVPALVYTLYLVLAPVVCLASAAWLVFRKRRSP